MTDFGPDVSRETSEKLKLYANLLRKWNKKINLVAPGTLKDLETRHFADSLQLLQHAPEEAQSWADLGSGGGFPGLVAAIQAQNTRPALKFTLVESDQRKAAFLRQVSRETDVPVTILATRIENLPENSKYDVLSARALASLPKLLDLTEQLRTPKTICVFPKGARFKQEMSEALDRWEFKAQTVPSTTDPSAAILVLTDISHA